jgi:hypothetical protein
VNSRRLAHINYKALPYICKAVTGLPELKDDHEGVCDGCAQGKNIKNPFPKRDSEQKKHWNSSIQMCVAECHHPPLMGMYTMYHSLMIILIKDLDILEVFNKIKEFKALIKNPSKRKIKILRSDNGGEYTSKEFVSFCRDVGIKRELTTPYNPQQNGVAERKNRTMLERSRSSYVLMGRSSYGSCLCADYPIVHLGSRPQKKCSPERSQR